ncbi:MAG: DUF58 domain-containing protein [Planctomycetes bacterium]|nr:DUF58 domain-containing protein [Planctomycetota bacterium]
MEGFLDVLDPLDSRQFAIAIKRLADCLSFGSDRSPFLGSGVEYVQSRHYQPGDPVRAIDWRVTARTGKPHIKEYEAPKRLPCWLLIDTSASMVTGSQPKTKYAQALHIAGGLAYACLDRMSPVGVLGIGERAFRVEPSLSRQQVLEWLLRLRHYRYDEGTSLGRRASELAARLNTRALIIVLSDLHTGDGIAPLKQLGQKNDVVVVQLRDPAERSLRGSGIFRAREAETGRDFVTHGRARFLDDTELQRDLKRAGVDRFVVDTDQPFAHRLRHFFLSRALLGKGAR